MTLSDYTNTHLTAQPSFLGRILPRLETGRQWPHKQAEAWLVGRLELKTPCLDLLRAAYSHVPSSTAPGCRHLGTRTNHV